jgi:hypothetical protein
MIRLRQASRQSAQTIRPDNPQGIADRFDGDAHCVVTLDCEQGVVSEVHSDDFAHPIRLSHRIGGQPYHHFP